jgi:hypothetical protein
MQDVINSFIADAWFDRKNGFKVDNVLAAVKLINPKITRKQVDTFAKNTRGKQVIHGKGLDIPIAITAQYNGQIIQIDLTHMPKSFTKFEYILTVIDVYSRHLWMRALRSKTAATVLQAFQDVEANAAQLLGKDKPFEIVEADHGSEFIAGLFRNYIDSQGYELRFSDVEDKHYLAIAERVHKTVKENSRELIENEGLKRTDWPEVLNDVVAAYNITKHRTTGAKPADVWGMKVLPNTSHQLSHRDLELPVGSKVRHELLSEKPGKVFGQKAYEPKWSAEVFEVKARDMNKFRIGKVGEESELPRRYARRELFVVPGGVIEAPARLLKIQLAEEDRRLRAEAKAQAPPEIFNTPPRSYNLRSGQK